MKKIGIAAGICAGLAFVFLAIGGIILAANSSRLIQYWDDPERSQNIESKKVQELFGAVTEIEIRANACKVNLIPSDTGEITAYLHGQRRGIGNRSDELELEVSEETILIQTRSKSFFQLFNWGELMLDITVPRTFAEKMTLDLNACTLEMDDFTLRTLKLKSNAGKINAGNKEIENLTLDINAVKCDMSGVHKQIKADVNAGSLRLELPGFQGSLDCEAIASDLEIYLPKDLSATVKTDMSAGSVKGDFDALNGDRLTINKTVILGDGESEICLEGSACSYMLKEID